MVGWVIQYHSRAVMFRSDQITSDPSLSHVRIFATPWIAARQASLSIINSRSSPRLTSIKSVMPSSHLILCHLFLLASVFPSIRVFSSKSALRIRWPKCWSFSFSTSPSSEYSGLISFRIDWFHLAFQGYAYDYYLCLLSGYSRGKYEWIFVSSLP